MITQVKCLHQLVHVRVSFPGWCCVWTDAPTQHHQQTLEKQPPTFVPLINCDYKYWSDTSWTVPSWKGSADWKHDSRWVSWAVHEDPASQPASQHTHRPTCYCHRLHPHYFMNHRSTDYCWGSIIYACSSQSTVIYVNNNQGFISMQN